MHGIPLVLLVCVLLTAVCCLITLWVSRRPNRYASVTEGGAPDRIRVQKGSYKRAIEARLCVDGGGNDPKPKVRTETAHASADDADSALGTWSAKQVARESAAQTAIAGVLIADSWGSIDPNMLAAFENFTHQQVDGFWDLATVAHASHYDLTNAWWTNQFPGHIAEQQVYQHLVDSGHAVTFPIAPNNPGWDLNVDGHLVNVKNYADLHGLSSHFSQHPDIPVIANFDGANPPDDVVNFFPGDHLAGSTLSAHNQLILDHGLTHASSVDAMAHAQDLSAHHGIAQHGLHAHAFPIGAFVVSGYREGKLLLRGDTDPTRAAMNLGIDVVAVGGGAKVGGAAGAIVGAHFGGVGAIPGALVGAMIGGISGRIGAGVLRGRPLKQAWERYLIADSEYKSAEAAAMADAQERWDRDSAAVSTDFHSSLREVADDALGDYNLIDETANLELTLTREQAVAISSEARLIAERYETTFAASADATLSRVRRLKRSASKWSRRVDRLVNNWDRTSEKTAALYDCVIAIPGTTSMTDQRIADVIALRGSAREILVQRGTLFQETALQIRATAIAALRELYDKLDAAARDYLSPYSNALEIAIGAYGDELAKAGHKPKRADA